MCLYTETDTSAATTAAVTHIHRANAQTHHCLIVFVLWLRVMNHQLKNGNASPDRGGKNLDTLQI